LDRAITLFVRTEGKKTHDDDEFEKNMSNPEVRKKVRTFRILTCLTALLKLLIFRVPFIRPDMAFAQKMWDVWDERLDQLYGLPRPSPRKNVKRLGTLTTMTCMNAVAHVFVYKQTVELFDAGKPTNEYPKGKPFDMGMLWECVQLLQPTREMIHQAWCMGLEYNIGTSAMGFCGMSIMAEACGRNVGDWMKHLPLGDFTSYLMGECEIDDAAAATDPTALRKHGGKWKQPSTNQRLPELEKMFDNGKSVSEEEICKMREQLRQKRVYRNRYKERCSRGEIQNAILNDTNQMIQDVLGRRPAALVVGTMEFDDAEHPGDGPSGGELSSDEDAFEKDQEAEEGREKPIDGAVTLAKATSHIWPNIIEATMYYKPQTLVQWAAGQGALLESGPGSNNVLGTRSNGGLFVYKKKTNGSSGAKRVDVAWFESSGGEWGKAWRKMADQFKNQKSHTIDMFDVHRDGLGDLLWLLSTKDNARRIADEPRVPWYARAENCIMNAENKLMTENDVVGYMAPFKDPTGKGPAGMVGAGNSKTGGTAAPPDHLERHEDSSCNCPLQQRVDTLLHAGRLAALTPLISNRVVVSPPIRMNPETGVEVNVGAMHDHSTLLAESVLACATMPGLRNSQEPFCNGQSGPEGLSVSQADAAANKKQRQSPDSNAVRMLPYSYDIISIAIAEDTARMLYDDNAEKWLEAYAEKLVKHRITDLTFDKLPHLSFRYLGYSEFNRQTLSIKLSSQRQKDQDYVEAGDTEVAASKISEAHVRRALGREVSGPAEIAAYIGRRQGARSMGKIKGDLFASSTWFEHATTTLLNRGVHLDNNTQAAVYAFQDMEQGIESRIKEAADPKTNPGWAPYKFTRTSPGTYSALAAQEATGKGTKRKNDDTGQRISTSGRKSSSAIPVRDAGGGEGGGCSSDA